MTGIRLQKYLASQGLASRRELERWMNEDRIKVNGQIASLGVRVVPNDKITVNVPAMAGNRAYIKTLRVSTQAQPKRKLLMYHKPVGEICSFSDPEGRKTVFENLPTPDEGRWVMIGRLDINTSGLLLFTTDGEFANQMMHPKYQVDREYLVRVLGEITPKHLLQLRQGVMLEDGEAKCSDVKALKKQGANQWLKLTLKEGRQHEVRRLMEAVGLQTNRLIRIRFGRYSLPRELKPKAWREIKVTGSDLGLIH